MNTCIERALRQMTALDRADCAIVTLVSPCEEDIRRVIRGYCHAQRDSRPGKPQTLPGNVLEVTGLGGIKTFDLHLNPTHLDPKGSDTLLEYLMSRTSGARRKEHELIYFPDIRETIGEGENQSRTPGQLQILEQIRDLAAMKRRGESNLLMVLGCTDGALCQSLRKDMYVLDIPCPDEEELKDILKKACEETAGTRMTGMTEKLAGELAVRLRGMREDDVRSIAAMAYAECENPLESHGKVMLETIGKFKRERLTGIRGLTWMEPEKQKVGGLEVLTAWLRSKANIFQYPYEAKAREARAPKGILLAGLPGCGKTHLALHAACILGKEDQPLPLLKMNFDDMLVKWQGDSEENFRMALRMAESAAPCVVLADEIEKAFAGVTGENAQGSMPRIFTIFLEWMNRDREKPVLVIATANRTELLPWELKRKGRFDEVFYVGIPGLDDIRDVLRIHLEAHCKVLDPGLLQKKETKREDGQVRERDGLDEVMDSFFRTAAAERRFLCGADVKEIVNAALCRLFDDWIEREKGRGRNGKQNEGAEQETDFPYGKESLQTALTEELRETRSFFDSNMRGTAQFWLDMQRDGFRDANKSELLDAKRDGFHPETGCFSEGCFAGLKAQSEALTADGKSAGDARKRMQYLSALRDMERQAEERQDYQTAFRCRLAEEIFLLILFSD